MRGSGPRPTPLVPGKRCVNQESCSGVNSGGAVVPDVEGVLLGATTVVGGGGGPVDDPAVDIDDWWQLKRRITTEVIECVSVAAD